MNSLETLERPSAALTTAPVLHQRGFTCTILTLQPDSEAKLPESASADEQLLFAIDGDIAVHLEGVTAIINQGGAHLVKAGTSPVLSAGANGPTRILRVEIPPRQVIEPQIITARA